MRAPELLLHFLGPLNRTGITYMVTGEFAAIVYGEPRLTNDVDLVVSLGGGDARCLVDAFPAPEFYAPPIEVVRDESARPAGGLFNLLHVDTALRADVYPVGEDPLGLWALARRRIVEAGPDSIPLAPIEYVILKKLLWIRESGADRHRTDIAAMLRLSGHLLDRPTLEAWVDRLGLEPEWQTFAG